MQINFARREIACKIVYYGPGMSGKTTNLEVLHSKTPREHKGELTCIATEGDRTLFFDFMPLNLGNIRGMNTKFQLYTVPGQVYYNSTRKLVLRGVDGVIFVADSSPDKAEENVESLRNLEENLKEYGRDLGDLPIVLQYNKRDRPDAVDVKLMNDKLNPGKWPWFEAVATDGTGVFDALKALAGLVIQNLDVQTVRTDEQQAAASREREPIAAAAGVARGGSMASSPSMEGRGPAGSVGTRSVAKTSAGAPVTRARRAASERPLARTETRTAAPREGGSKRSTTRDVSAAGRRSGPSPVRPLRTQPRMEELHRDRRGSSRGSKWIVVAVAATILLSAAGAAWFLLM